MTFFSQSQRSGAHVDNFCTVRGQIEDLKVFDCSVTAFGKMLKTLREQRGLSQTELAAATGVALMTVQRAESSTPADFRVRRSTLADILTALHQRAPLKSDEAKQFLRAAGMSEGLLDAIDKVASDMPPTHKGWSSPDRETVHLWVDVLASTLGDKAVMSILHGYAAGMQVELPPRVGAARPITPQSKSRSGT